jgi:uncharacterized protein YutE (UPF0331/DUF86 family)
MTIMEQNRELLDAVTADLRARGYRVFIEPSLNLLPPDLRDLRVDAIAFRENEKLAIEIVVEGEVGRTKEQRLKERFDRLPEWKLEVYFVRPGRDESGLTPVSAEAIDTSIDSIKRLIEQQQYAAALLVGWATTEAISRALSPKKFARPQTPGRLVEVLAQDGFVTPSEADEFRQLYSVRNELIHGGLNRAATREQLTSFLKLLITLRTQMT